MPFPFKSWRDRGQGPPKTPVNAAAMMDLEQRVAAYVDDQTAGAGVNVLEPLSPGDALTVDENGHAASLGPVVSRVPAAATIDSRDARGNITQITEGGVVTTYTWWLGDGTIPDDSVKTETTLGVTKTFTYSAGVLTGWTVA